MERAPSFTEWNVWLGRAIAALEGPELPSALIQGLRWLLPIDTGAMFGFWRNRRPQVLYSEYIGAKVETYVDLYLEGAYLLDPFYRASLRGALSGLTMLSEVAPPAWQESEYFLRFYRRTGVVDEATYTVRMSSSSTCHLSLARASDPFGAEEIERLRAVEPVVCALLKHHARKFLLESDPTSADLHKRVETVLESFGRSVLTKREAEVIRLTLDGHSARSTAQELGIAPDTVKLHRKNAFVKLDVSSQAELFSLFIGSLRCVGEDPTLDPLSSYLGSPRVNGDRGAIRNAPDGVAATRRRSDTRRS